ncbi:MAG TPA: acyl-CoA dehydrogenase [Clostridia bacterium]|nr:acyl-CoA dehydrogenase [Clostridia bacterium]
MDYRLTDEQLALQKMAREFAQREIVPLARKMDEQEELDPFLVKRLAEYGLQSLNTPVEYGGSGLDAMGICIVLEELARGCASVAVASAATALAAYPLLLAGTDEQKKRFLPPIGEGGGLASFCLTEAEAGSDAASIATTAVRVGREYVLNGIKAFVSNGGLAEFYLVFATTDRTKGSKGISAFVVPKGTPGLRIGKKLKTMGIRAADTREIVLEDVRVPAGHLVGREGQGFVLAMEALDLARPGVGAMSVGIAQAAFDMALQYAKQRHQFGKPIAEFQTIQMMLADMAMKVEAARHLVYQAAFTLEQGLPFTKEAAMAKAFASDVAMEVTTQAVQILGGYGFTRDYLAEKYMRDAKIMQIFEGTNQIQRLVIAKQLLA